MAGSIIEYRILHTMAELEEAVNVQLAVWKMNPRNTVPAALMHVFSANRGLVMGAYDGNRMVGVLVSLPANPGDEWILWSHMTGVDPAYQGRRIGVELKLRQRLWALENGYRTIRWTADPLQRGNANFNLELLGREACVYIDTYHVNFYGDMDDDINRGMPSDRIEATWHIDQPSLHRQRLTDVTPLLYANAAGEPVLAATDGLWNAPAYTAAVPGDLERLRRESQPTLLAWRLALREAMQAALAHGYIAVHFINDDTNSAYYLTRREDLE
jgi:predicted GNAT superfamily acetyltransferase